MKVGEIYSLRMALVNAGYIPVPCWDRKPVITLRSAPSEGFVRSWATVHPEADQTGIVVGDRVIVVVSLEDARTATTSPKECARSEPPPSPSLSQSPSPRQRAGSFLVDYLAGEAKPSKDVIEAALATGIHMITLRRAKREIGVIAEPVKSNGWRVDGWMWRLPDKSDDHGPNGPDDRH